MTQDQTPEGPLSEQERHALRAAAGSMIPPGPAFGVPGADDDRIFTDILSVAEQEARIVRRAMRRLDEAGGAPFAVLDAVRQAEAAAKLRERWPDQFMQLVGVIVRCYYRDDRVMKSLGMEPRAPFPKGFEVPQGDWSLLDPVRARGRIYRDAP